MHTQVYLTFPGDNNTADRRVWQAGLSVCFSPEGVITSSDVDMCTVFEWEHKNIWWVIKETQRVSL